MELDDLKQAWSQYDTKLTENLKTNRELLKNMNLDRAKSAMDTPKNYEFFNVIIGFIVLVFIAKSTVEYASDIRLLISGLFSLIWLALTFYFSVVRLKCIMNLDFFNQTIINTQNQLNTFKRKYLCFKKIEMYTFPIFIIVFPPIIGKALRGFDILSHPMRYSIAVIIGLVFAYPIMIWIYKNWYDKKLNATNQFLTELKKFKEEEQ